MLSYNTNDIESLRVLAILYISLVLLKYMIIIGIILSFETYFIKADIYVITYVSLLGITLYHTRIYLYTTHFTLRSVQHLLQ